MPTAATEPTPTSRTSLNDAVPQPATARRTIEQVDELALDSWLLAPSAGLERLDLHVPVPAEQARGVDQVVDARRDAHGADDEGDREAEREDRRANRHRRPAAPGLQRHPHAGDGRAPAHQLPSSARAVRDGRRLASSPTCARAARQAGHAASAARRAPRRAPRARGSASKERPGSGSAVRAGPSGMNGERAKATTDGEHRGADGHERGAQHAEQEELAVAAPQCRQRRRVRAGEEALARQGLPDEEQGGETDHEREDAERADVGRHRTVELRLGDRRGLERDRLARDEPLHRPAGTRGCRPRRCAAGRRSRSTARRRRGALAGTPGVSVSCRVLEALVDRRSRPARRRCPRPAGSAGSRLAAVAPPPRARPGESWLGSTPMSSRWNAEPADRVADRDALLGAASDVSTITSSGRRGSGLRPSLHLPAAEAIERPSVARRTRSSSPAVRRSPRCWRRGRREQQTVDRARSRGPGAAGRRRLMRSFDSVPQSGFTRTSAASVSRSRRGYALVGPSRARDRGQGDAACGAREERDGNEPTPAGAELGTEPEPDRRHSLRLGSSADVSGVRPARPPR